VGETHSEINPLFTHTTNVLAHNWHLLRDVSVLEGGFISYISRSNHLFYQSSGRFKHQLSGLRLSGSTARQSSRTSSPDLQAVSLTPCGDRYPVGGGSSQITYCVLELLRDQFFLFYSLYYSTITQNASDWSTLYASNHIV